MLRIDDIPQRVADDIHAFGVIGMRIILNLLHSALNCAIIKSERRCYNEKSINFFIFTYLNSYALILSGELVW